MEFDPFLGKRLTAMSVFEPWKERGTQPIRPPLFGAIALEFGDIALLFESPLRYSRAGWNASLESFMAPGGLHSVTTDYRPIVCDMDQLRWHKRLVEHRSCVCETDQSGFHKRVREDGVSVLQPSIWTSVLPESRHRLVLDNLPDLRRLYGQTLLAMSPVSDTVMELRFSGQDFPLWLTYREDLDGAIQVAWAGWHHQITAIVVSEPDCAFGWLHPNAPYSIRVKAKCWPNISRYIESARWEATRSQRDPRSQNENHLLAIHEEALRLKFEAHPQLARRFAAIRYPIFSECVELVVVASQALHRLRAAHSTTPAS